MTFPESLSPVHAYLSESCLVVDIFFQVVRVHCSHLSQHARVDLVEMHVGINLNLHT